MSEEEKQAAPAQTGTQAGGKKSKAGLIIAIVVIVLVALGAASYFAWNWLARETAEKILETGTDADIEIDNNKTTIESEDGTLEHSETSTWPTDLPSGIEKYTDGTIESVTKNNDNEFGMAWYINIVDTTKSATETYSSKLTAAGYPKSSSMENGNFLIIAHDDGTYTVTLSFDGEDNSLTIGVSKNASL